MFAAMADEAAAPYLPEPVLPARPTQTTREPLFASRPLTFAEMLAETEPPARKPRRVPATRAARSISGSFVRVVAAVTRVGGARGTTARHT